MNTQNNDLLSNANRAARAALGGEHTVVSIEEWGGGAHNRGYQLHLENGERLFWKVEAEDIFPRPRRGQVEREAAGIALAVQAGVDCPRILGYDTSKETAGCRYILEEFVDGELLGQVMPSLNEPDRARVMAQFQANAERLCQIEGELFGELTPGGALGQHPDWTEWMASFSKVLIEDAETLGAYSAEDMALVRRAHAAALEHFHYAGPPAFNHLDLHIFNAFAAVNDGQVWMGKLFDFGFCLFLPPYVTRYNQDAFSGREAQIAREFGVLESELHAFHLIFALEFTNFITALRWAPDQPYGYTARLSDYLEQCRAYCSNLGSEKGYFPL